MESIYRTLYICHSWFSSILLVNSSYGLASISAWRTSYSISHKAGLLATNSLRFSLWKVFISPSLLQHNFSGYKFISWWVFSLNTKIFTPLSACLITEEKSNVIVPALVRCFFPLPLSGFFYDWFSLTWKWYAYV